MKKTLSLILCLTVLFTAVVPMALTSAAENGEISLEMPTIENVIPGQEVTMDVVLLNGATQSGVDFQVQYDSSKLTYVNATASDIFSAADIYNVVNAETPAESYVNFAAAAGALGAERVVILQLTFTVNSDVPAGSIPLTFANVLVSDVNAETQVSAENLTNGAIVVTDKPVLSIADASGNATITANPGDTVALDFTLNNAGAAASLEGTVTFDAERLEFVSAADDSLATYVPETGVISFADRAETDATVKIQTLTFTVKDTFTAGSTDVTVENLVVKDSEGTAIEGAAVNGATIQVLGEKFVKSIDQTTTASIFTKDATAAAITALLPQQLSATFSDDTTANVNVTWAAPAEFAEKTAGTYDFVGTIADSEEYANPDGVKAVAKVTVVNQKVVRVTPVQNEANVNSVTSIITLMSYLPTQVDAVVQNSLTDTTVTETIKASVIWDQNSITPAFRVGTAGTYTITGELTNLPAGVEADESMKAQASIKLVTSGTSTTPGGSVTYPGGSIIPGGSKIDFEDLGGYEWAESAINALVDDKIINGVTKKTYEPGRNITRAEFTKIIVEAFDLTASGYIQLTDVPLGSWYYDYIMIGYKNGIIQGISETEFAPDAPITREQASAILYRTMQKLNIPLNKVVDPITFNDPGSDYAKEAISALQQAGIIQGRGDNYFAPFANITRAEAAVLIYNAYKLK